MQVELAPKGGGGRKHSMLRSVYFGAERVVMLTPDNPLLKLLERAMEGSQQRVLQPDKDEVDVLLPSSD